MSNLSNEEIEAERHESMRRFGNLPFAPLNQEMSRYSDAQNPQRAIRELMELYARRYSINHLTFGCIGNVWNDGRANPDDRAWYIFSDFVTDSTWGERRAHFGGYSTAQLSNMLAAMHTHFENWIRRYLGQVQIPQMSSAQISNRIDF